jgi:hypothetical protein
MFGSCSIKLFRKCGNALFRGDIPGKIPHLPGSAFGFEGKRTEVGKEQKTLKSNGGGDHPPGLPLPAVFLRKKHGEQLQSPLPSQCIIHIFSVSFYDRYKFKYCGFALLGKGPGSHPPPLG